MSNTPADEGQTAVRAEGLRFAYPPLCPGAHAPWVLDGLDLEVRAGEWLAIMGASDVGKTTLCLLLAGLAPHLTGGNLEGRVLVAGRDTQLHPPPALADVVGLVFQEVEAQVFNPSVEAEIAWGLENLGLPQGEIRARVEAALAMFRLEPLRTRPPDDLSGGEKKRVALASVLAMQPAVIILDEPLGGLDPAGREEVLAALSTLRRELAAAIVMTEGDAEAVAAFAHRLVVLERPKDAGPDGGTRVALDGPPGAVFRHVERLESLGVELPQQVRVAAGLNRRLGTRFDFSTSGEALEALAAYLG